MRDTWSHVLIQSDKDLMLRDIFGASNETWNFWVKTKWMLLVNLWNRIWGDLFSFGRHGQKNVNPSCSCMCFTPGERPHASFRTFGLIKSRKRCGSRMTTRAVPGLWYFMSILCSGLWVGDVQFPAKDNRLRWRNKWITKVMILFRFHFLCLLYIWGSWAESGR